MKSIRYILLGLISVLISCTTNTGLPRENKSPDTKTPFSSQPVSDRTKEATTLPSSMVPTELQLTPTQDSLVPEWIRQCPDQRNLSLLELDINNGTLLVIASKSNEQGGIWTVAGSDQEPTMIPNTQNVGMHIREFEDISPSQRWIAFSEYREGESDKALIVSSIEGDRQWEVQSFDARMGAFWMTEETILFYLYDAGYISPVMTIDPFTLEKKSLKPPNHLGQIYNIFVIDEKLYEIYYGIFQEVTGEYRERFTLYDYEDDDSEHIFQWLEDGHWDGGKTQNIFIGWAAWVDTRGSATVVVENPNGFDIAVSIDLFQQEIFDDYNEVMTSIILPDEFTNMRIIAISANSNMFVFDRFDRLSGNQYSSNLYMYNYRDNKLVDYCIDRGEASRSAHASYDGRFLAWNKYQRGTSSGDPESIVVLDLHTGYFASVEVGSLLGWGDIGQSPSNE